MFKVFCFLFLSGLLLIGQPALGQDNEVKDKLKTLAAEQVKTNCSSCKIEVECKWISAKIASLPANRINDLYFSGAGIPKGYVNAKVGLEDTALANSASVQLFITVRKKIPVARKTLKRGEVINKKDLTWKWQDITRLNREPISSIEDFKNKTVTRLIQKGSLFFASDLAGANQLQTGDAVEMLYSEGGVQIKINCIVRKAKKESNKIRLYSKETRQRYLAKVIDKNKIIWVKTL